MLAGVLSAAMSTVASVLIGYSGLVTRDLYQHFFRKTASEAEQVILGRAVVLVILLVSFLIALSPTATLFAMVNIYNGVGALFFPLVILSLFWRRFNRPAAVSGFVVTVAFTFFLQLPGVGLGLMDKPWWLGFQSVVWGWIAGIIVYLVVNYVTPKPPNTIQEKFFSEA